MFSDIASQFADLLQGRVFAAHNAAFDLRFLEAEFARAGEHLAVGTPSICTMSLGKNFGLGATCSLVRACTTYGIDHARAHTAGDDSHATAQLLAAYHRASSTWPGWAEYWERTAHTGRTYVYPTGRATGVGWKARVDIPAETASFLERISFDVVRDETDGAGAEYLALLDRCLLDGHVSVSEGAQLAEVAEMLGLSRAALDGLHTNYYRQLERRAWEDGVLTDDEKADLAAVASLLQIDTLHVASTGTAPRAVIHDATDSVGAFALEHGDVIVLTGDMARDRSDWEAELRDRGFVPHPAVTKKVKLVVAADPDSLSGKAKKARDYGIPIVDESGLARLLANNRDD